MAERDLMDSLGQEAIKEQMEMAEEDLEEEEEGAGDDYRYRMMMILRYLTSISNLYRKGDWCRAAWSEDGKPMRVQY